MSRIAFIGLGNMGMPMALNLVRAGHDVQGFDISEAALAGFAGQGGQSQRSVAAAVDGASIVISIVRNADDVKNLYCTAGGVLDVAAPGALLIESSTIGPAAARAVAAEAAQAGFAMLDAPVAGGQAGAREARLTFMVGGARTAFDRAEPVLRQMGARIFYAGASGNGQIAKLCNNLIACVSSAVVSEAFILGSKLGMDYQTMYDIITQSTGQCWTLSHNCPVPGPVPSSPASRDYVPGFAADLMLKDLSLVASAASEVGAATPFGARAIQLYRQLSESGLGARDWTVVARLIENSASLN
ncbi:3-hydroxyisobutyrate dehydrogenase [Cupriavidus necator]|uniref:3-hydroxyisobutyrate dehydrogenase n=1 Tax=Cupriavidus necator (strain ATCC 17699 / DSM 428 / KCTC 22496 / NCIMB 10442 / H16 / Stanier 337) TaxID=381666 RepID=Q0K0E2_CUPNH|nr:3-hydroxyisobutyrate dehydrogenase [Cupriavidus necator]QCC04364.1 3-hydroxyisobutyrate dehydrogenase [Cupriavidus necator H16]QQB79052.1 3-hydroxyisobutyrate dehydrogenase [Cupriavidus necator]WKA43273.1 3-hydroxyisobutyrate dehydrogenase [Cupriavidus necator]CAJ96532.1 3-Hydroxyisobutyrate dehydrogenase [Cupriavidus necator H16]